MFSFGGPFIGRGADGGSDAAAAPVEILRTKDPVTVHRELRVNAVAGPLALDSATLVFPNLALQQLTNDVGELGIQIFQMVLAQEQRDAELTEDALDQSAERAAINFLSGRTGDDNIHAGRCVKA